MSNRNKGTRKATVEDLVFSVGQRVKVYGITENFFAISRTAEIVDINGGVITLKGRGLYRKGNGPTKETDGWDLSLVHARQCEPI